MMTPLPAASGGQIDPTSAQRTSGTRAKPMLSLLIDRIIREPGAGVNPVDGQTGV
jgi:hypothetical protein